MKEIFEGIFTKKVKDETSELSVEQKMDALAATIMHMIERRVSPTLFQRLCEVVYPFRGEAQRKMATSIWKFLRHRTVTSTGNPSVDVVLNCCYLLMGAERKMVKKPLRNKLAAAQLIELEEKKEKQQGELVDLHIKMEAPCEKNRCGIVFRKCCCTCKNRCQEVESKNTCLELGIEVASTDLCRGWKVAPSYEKVGMSKGKVKSREYLMWVLEQRVQETRDIEAGLMDEEDRRSVETLRNEWCAVGTISESKYGVNAE